MIPKPLDKIEKNDIDALIENKVAEGRQIEYKRELPGKSDKNKHEFLADVSSFANAAGGDLLYGVDAKDGIPIAAIGLPEISPDKETLRLEEMRLSGIDPRIPGVQIRPVDGFERGPVLIVRVPDSWASPHMVTFNKASRFFSRTSTGKYQLDVREIRSAFALSDALPERIRRFRDERLAKIVADQGPITLPAGPKTVLHVVPLSAFHTAHTISIDAIESQRTKLIPMFHYNGAYDRLNVDGFITYAGGDQSGTSGDDYLQVFRTGIFEYTSSYFFCSEDPKVFFASELERDAARSVESSLEVMKSLGCQPPVLVMISCMGVRGSCIKRARHARPMTPIDRDNLLLPDVWIEDFNCDVQRVMQPIFDAMWNAAGIIRSPNYDKDGNPQPL